MIRRVQSSQEYTLDMIKGIFTTTNIAGVVIVGGVSDSPRPASCLYDSSDQTETSILRVKH